jgi:hypothetical protein
MKSLKCSNWSGRIQSLIPPAILTSLLHSVFSRRSKESGRAWITRAIFAILSLIGMTGACLGQGTVNWQTIYFTAITAQTNTQQWSPLFGGESTGGGAIGNTAPASSGLIYYYELLYNTNFTGSQMPTPYTVAALLGTWHDTGLTATNSNAFGGGRLMPVNPNAAAVVPWNYGTTNNIMLLGWSANLGTSWAAVSNKLANWDYYRSTFWDDTFFGESATGYLTPEASGTSPGAAVFATGPTTNGLPIYSLNMQLYWLSPPESGGGGGVTNATGGGGVVTNCTEAALRAAIAGGGTATFACDGTIVLANTISITTNTVLDGTGHQITISGGGNLRVFYVGVNATLGLVNLTVANGFSANGGGAIFNTGSLNANNCQFVHNMAVGCSGTDAIYRDLARPGLSGYGGAIYNSGNAVITRSSFMSNSVAGGSGGSGGPPHSGVGPSTSGGSGGGACGGAIYNAGSLTLQDSTLAANSANGGTGGHGGTGINGNYSYTDGQSGGAGGPGGSAYGATIFNAGTANIVSVTVVSNRASGGMGGAGGSGGGPYGSGSRGGDGGNGGIGGSAYAAIFNTATANLANVTVVSNRASGGGGGRGGQGGESGTQIIPGFPPGASGGNGGNGGDGISVLYGVSSLTNCTVALNIAFAGLGGSGGLGGRVPGAPNGTSGTGGVSGTAVGGVKLVSGVSANTLLAGNSPSNCSGTITDAGHNLSSDASCAFTAAGSMNNTDPKLGPLADNGGPTLTMALLPGSPAIDAGSAVGTPATDQRGVPRPQGHGVDIGAYEYQYIPVFTSATIQSTTNCQLKMAGLWPNLTLTLQVSTNLVNWWDATNFVAGSNGVFQCNDPIPGNVKSRFYRLKSGTP